MAKTEPWSSSRRNFVTVSESHLACSGSLTTVCLLRARHLKCNKGVYVLDNPLTSGKTLAGCGVREGSTVHWFIRLGLAHYQSMLHYYALDAKEKIEGEEASTHLTLDERVAIMGKCTEALFWLKKGRQDGEHRLQVGSSHG